MKYLIALSLIFIFTGIQSQNMIVNESGLWSTLEQHCLPWGNSYTTYFIKFSGDTVVENKTYKKVLKCEEETQSEWSTYGLIREDEENRVFLRPVGYIEGLVYDFGVSVGDSIIALNVFINPDTLHFVVTQVDSVLLLNGYRKRVTLFEYNNIKEEVWIEGVGSLFGILNSCNDSYGGLCGGYEGLCFEEDGTLVYRVEEYDDCYVSIITNIEDRESPKLTISPNPAKSFVNLTFSEAGYKEIDIYNLQGVKLISVKGAGNQFTVNLEQLKKDIYIFTVRSNDIIYPSYKLIVD